MSDFSVKSLPGWYGRQRLPNPSQPGQFVPLLLKLIYGLILLTFNNIYLYINFVKAALTSAIRGIGAEGDIPAWLAVMSEEDMQFLRRFFLSSGSLKAMAEEYGISYPTVRARLDRLIAKVQAAEDPAIADPFRRKLRLMVVDGKISSEAARELWTAYRAVWKEGEQK